MPKKILLADDSITIQKVIELTFSDEDFEVVTVGNGRQALEKLAEVRPDIVLCDIIMGHLGDSGLGDPEKDGYECCRQIKMNPAFAQTPVLLLTGAFEAFDEKRAAEVGSDGYLMKPFEPETLIGKVKDLLDRAAGAAGAPPGVDQPAAPGTTAPTPVVSTPPVEPAPPSPAPSPADHPAATTTAPQAPAWAPTVEPSPPAGAAFIPEEPFATFDAGEVDEAAPTPTEEPLAPVTPEESATLAGAGAAEDSASTVMFTPGELPWTGTTPPSAPAVGREEAPGVPDLAEEAGGAFEEVLEEDVEFGGAGFAPGTPEALSTHPAAPLGFTPGEPLSETAAEVPAPVPPSPTSTAPPTEYETPTAPTPQLETVPPLAPEVPAPPRAPEPPPSFEVTSPPEPAAPVPSFEPPPVFEVATPTSGQPQTPPPLETQAPAELTPEPQLAPLAGPEPTPEPWSEAPALSPPPPDEEVSFADVQTLAEPESVPATPSEAASVPVPVEQVEKIAQRVVAQVSEKVVREIAWEVIPDLAEALIKQEIERLKAELEKL